MTLPIGVLGPWTPLAARKVYPLWDRVKTERLAQDPCPEVDGAQGVNAWVNALLRFVPDPERWQAPAETLKWGTGDCKDYVVLKRAILLAKGAWAETELVLVVGDNLVPMRERHAVLWTPAGILDNWSDAVLDPAELLSVFEPQLAFTQAASYVYVEAPTHA